MFYLQEKYKVLEALQNAKQIVSKNRKSLRKRVFGNPDNLKT